ncbi:MAG TPA: hypothetical protein VJ724_10845 [Tahibacter sp.]|nr:hypothetical protein [Tahibacter sp.]
MGVFFSVGVLAAWRRDPDNYGNDIRAYFDAIDNTLRRHGLPPHVEPESLPPLAPRIDHVGISATRLHDLRLVYACAVAGDHDFASDESIVREIADPTHHLLRHCDCEGCYVPVDFDEVIFDDETSDIGSTPRLMRELLFVAPLLGVRLDGAHVSDVEIARLDAFAGGKALRESALLVWLLLYEAARLSLEHRTALVFS